MPLENGRLYVKEDIEDWHQEYKDNDRPALDKENLVVEFVVDAEHSTAEAGRMLIAIRELLGLPEDFVMDNRLMLQVGAQREVLRMIEKQKTSVKAKGGKRLKTRKYISQRWGNAGEEDAGEHTGFVHVDTEEGERRARNYLMNTIVAKIFERLKAIKLHGGDVKAVAEELKSAIDDRVAVLV
jgi:hypothetical protein